jgi:hypothetical protein
MPELRNDLNQPEAIDRLVRLVRLLKLGGIGETLAGKISASKLIARSQAFRGNDAD